MNELFGLLEKAVKAVFADWLRPVQHADVVLQVYPVWASAKTLRAITGLNRDQLNKFVIERKVIAKSANGNVIYKVADVLASIDSLPNRTKGE